MVTDFNVDTLTPVMEHFGLEASLKVQAAALRTWPGGFVSPKYLHSLGLRETGLLNERGGAVLVNGVWEPTDTDEGWLQITNTIETNRVFLASIPGCPNNSWVPDMAGWHATGKAHVTALTPGHNPTLSAALTWTLESMVADRARAYTAGVHSDHVLAFIIAAHNAGFGGALQGYEEGDVDKHTTHGDYSAWVLRNAEVVGQWLASRPKWQWHA